jgi:protein-tyrosine-phosphatase
MQPIEVLVVCRYNQARSIVVGALLRKLFPQLLVTTAGIEAPDGSSIPTISMDLCERWGLQSYDRVSKDLSRFSDTTSFKHILAADEFVYNHLKDTATEIPIGLLTSYSPDDLLVPIDPTGLDSIGFYREIAKASISATRWAADLLDLPHTAIQSLLFLTQNSLFKGVNDGDTLFANSSLLVDTEFSYPDPSVWKNAGIETVLFNPRDLDSIDLEKITSTDRCVLVSRFEVDLPERILLSLQWSELLSSLSRERKISLVSRLFGPRERQYLGILGVLHSQNTRFA